MPRVRDLLYRFRPAGAPGAATPAGVPADHIAELEAELEPVFAEFAGVERDIAQLGAEARRAADETRRHAAQRAHAIVKAATDQQDAERAAAGQRLRQQSAMASDALLAAAAQEASALRNRVACRLPACVERVVASVDCLIGEVRAPTTTPTAQVSR